MQPMQAGSRAAKRAAGSGAASPWPTVPNNSLDAWQLLQAFDRLVPLCVCSGNEAGLAVLQNQVEGVSFILFNPSVV